ncbi:hypothetical protein [Labilibaculum sp.]|uniref:hypothetical protein n=1 Tax=Labilibaculum sp. TaxID=2060723 RepID=UPI0035696368
MIQKDFIMRMIEMIAEVIARIIGLIKGGDPEQASLLLENAYRDFLKEDASYFRRLSKEELTHDLLEKHNYGNGHLEILAELFLAEGELNFAKGDVVNSLNYYEKSYLLLEFTVQNSKSFSLAKESKMIQLKEKIETIK